MFAWLLGWLNDAWQYVWEWVGGFIWFLIDPSAWVDTAMFFLNLAFEFLYTMTPPALLPYMHQVLLWFSAAEDLVAVILYLVSPIVHPTVLVGAVGAYMQIWAFTIVVRTVTWVYGMIPGGQGTPG